MELQKYQDLLANVRYDGDFHSISALVQPDDPQVREVASILAESGDFIYNCQEFVHSFTQYEPEEGDYWTTPAEILEARAGDCDDKAILLCSLLRNQLPANRVFCAFGFWKRWGRPGGHMWVMTDDLDGTDRIIESTAGPDMPLQGQYMTEALFNDRYAFSYPAGIRNFNLVPIAEES